MTPVHAIIVVIIRLWAASVIITFVGALPFYAVSELFSGDGGTAYSIALLVNNFIWMIVGIIAWVGAPKLSQLAYRADESSKVEIGVHADDLVMIGSFLIGGYYLVQYVPEMFVSLGAAFIEFQHAEPTQLVEPQKRLVTSYSAQEFYTDASIIAIASWMAFRPAHIAHLFSKLRSVGHFDYSRVRTEKNPESL